MGFVYEKAIDPQIVEVDGVVLPALGKLFQLLFVLLKSCSRSGAWSASQLSS